MAARRAVRAAANLGIRAAPRSATSASCRSSRRTSSLWSRAAWTSPRSGPNGSAPTSFWRASRRCRCCLPAPCCSSPAASTLKVDAQNGPCRIAGRSIAEHAGLPEPTAARAHLPQGGEAAARAGGVGGEAGPRPRRREPHGEDPRAVDLSWLSVAGGARDMRKLARSASTMARCASAKPPALVYGPAFGMSLKARVSALASASPRRAF